MRVTGLRTRVVELTLDKPILSSIFEIRLFGCVLIFLDSDMGLTGESLVFSINNKRLPVLHEMVTSLAPLVTGRDPDHSTAFWADAWREINFLGHKGVPVVGVSGIDGALWDLRGKAAERNIAQLIGQCHDAVPAYASGGLWLSSTIDELVQEAQRFVEMGFRAMKMRLGLGLAKDVERVKAVRDAVGPGIGLMADSNQGLTEAEAIRLGRELEPFHLTWFEEPLPPFDIAGSARIADKLDTPIATGETEYTRYGFLDLLKARAADVLMPDMQRVGGVTEFVRVGHMAQAYNTPVSSHLFPEMSLSVLAGLENATFLEVMPWFSPLYNETLEIQHGRAAVPDRPGWGFTFNEDVIALLERK